MFIPTLDPIITRSFSTNPVEPDQPTILFPSANAIKVTRTTRDSPDLSYQILQLVPSHEIEDDRLTVKGSGVPFTCHGVHVDVRVWVLRVAYDRRYVTSRKVSASVYSG
jgi:hypothetical protein